MSVNVIVYGAEQTSDEYVAALKLKQIIQDSLPNSAIGEIVLFASATLVGQAVKDVDLLMIGEVQNYSVNAEFQTEAEGFVKDRVAISSFCTTIEIKRHDISSIFVNGTDFYVKYGTRNHCVTSQSNKQKIATMKFFEKTLMVSPYITNIIWFTQATPGDIKKLLTNNGRTMPSNVLGSDFDFKELMQLLIWQQPPHKRWNAYTFDSSYNAGSLQAIQNALSLFSKTKAHMGEMTRRRIEQLTNKAFQTNALIDPQGKVSIYRGRAGTGKTVGLIRTAIHLVDEGQARVLMLTYNKALVSDIRRLFALAELPDMFEANCLHINTMHSYFFQLSKNNMPGGKVIITTDDKLFDVHNQEMQRLSGAGNIAYDMLYLVPHALVKRSYGDSSFSLKTKFEQNGIHIWDGTASNNRESFSIDAEEVRLLQYDSARGLEGWTVVCMDFDVFLEEKSAEYQDETVDALMLESPKERKKKHLYNWAMIPLTRAIDTIIITIKSPTSETARLLKEISEEHPDFVSWL